MHLRQGFKKKGFVALYKWMGYLLIKDWWGIYFLNFERFLLTILRDFLKNAVTLSVFELDKCSLHINGVAFDKDFNGDPKHHKILLVVGIPTKNRQSKKERTNRMYIHVAFISGFHGNTQRKIGHRRLDNYFTDSHISSHITNLFIGIVFC